MGNEVGRFRFSVYVRRCLYDNSYYRGILIQYPMSNMFGGGFNNVAISGPYLSGHFLTGERQLFRLTNRICSEGCVSFPMSTRVIRAMSLSRDFTSIFRVARVFSVPCCLRKVCLARTSFSNNPIHRYHLV